MSVKAIMEINFAKMVKQNEEYKVMDEKQAKYFMDDLKQALRRRYGMEEYTEKVTSDYTIHGIRNRKAVISHVDMPCNIVNVAVTVENKTDDMEVHTIYELYPKTFKALTDYLEQVVGLEVVEDEE